MTVWRGKKLGGKILDKSLFLRVFFSFLKPLFIDGERIAAKVVTCEVKD